MNKKRQYSISLLTALALITLVGIQLFWFNQLMDQERLDFRKKAQNALEKIAIRHEKAEDFRKYKAIWKQKFKGRYKDMLMEEFENFMSVHEEVKIRDTIIKIGDKDYSYLIITGKTIDSLTGMKVQHQVLAKNVKDFEELISPEASKLKHDVNGIPVKWGKIEMKELFKKSRYISDLMVQAFRNDLFLAATERVDILLLDSILSEELKKEGLPLSYHFQVIDNKDSLIKSSVTIPHYIGGDFQNPFVVRLFPSDIFNEPITLKVQFLDLNNFIWKGLWGVFFGIIVLIIITVAAFALMYKTLISQRNLSEMKSDFISNMTHEFKTPISTIALACEALKDADMSKDVQSSKSCISMIGEENRRLENLVETILQSAVLDKGELQLHLQKIEFNGLVHSLMKRTKMRIDALGGTLDAEIAIGDCYVLGDHTHLSNVVNNLIDNAIKYSKNKLSIKVTTQCEGDFVTLTVEDKGVGIKKEYLSRIFDKLYRIPTGNVHDVKGFGLGLSYVKSIIDLHKGEISVESQPTEGSIFKIKLKQYYE